MQQELAAHSLQLAQRAEAISRLAEDPGIVRMNVERYRAILASDGGVADGEMVERLLHEAEDALSGYHTLLALAAWYRDFAERAGNPVILEARIHMAEELEREAACIERRQHVAGQRSNSGL